MSKNFTELRAGLAAERTVKPDTPGQSQYRDLIGRVLMKMAEWEGLCAEYLQTTSSNHGQLQVRRGVFDLIREGEGIRIENRGNGYLEIPGEDSYRMVIILANDADQEGKIFPTANRSDVEKGSRHAFLLSNLNGRAFLIDPFNRRPLTTLDFEAKEDTKTDEGWPLPYDHVLTIYAQTEAEREYSVEFRVLNYLPSRDLLVRPRYTDHKLISIRHADRLLDLMGTVLPGK